jgi:Leucine-rich repeat (LRR) protein
VRELRAERAELASLVLALPALRELALRGNQLAALSDTIGHARQLRALDLRGNALDTLPDALRELPLAKLDLRWNPLRAAPAWLAELRERGCLVYT